MTNKNIEARRAAFEAFAKNRGASLVKDQAGRYLITENEWAFDIWNAALDSICVELPFETYGCMDADKVKESLTTSGVSYK